MRQKINQKSRSQRAKEKRKPRGQPEEEHPFQTNTLKGKARDLKKELEKMNI